MSHVECVENEFEANRPRLEAIAYRMLGSRESAEDAVQETWLRVARSDANAIENLAGWLTTVVGRVCLDRLKAHRETHAGAEISELPDESTENDPEHIAVVADSVGSALMVVIDSMAPEERVAFVLHDVFAVPFDSISAILDRSPDATRQLASRARRRVQGSPNVPKVDLVQHRTLVEAFLQAARGGNLEELMRLLDPNVVLQPDAAALQMGSKPVTRGAEEVAAAISGGARGTRLVLANGLPALAWGTKEKIRSIIEFEIDGERIVAIRVTADTDRIAELDVVALT